MSHVNMGAFFSGTDNNDDKNTGYSLVLGKIDTNPEAAFRATCNGNFFPVTLADVFNSEIERLHPNSDYSVKEELYSKVSERKYATAANKYPATTGHSYYNPGAYKPTSTYNPNSVFNTIYAKISSLRYCKEVAFEKSAKDFIADAISAIMLRAKELEVSDLDVYKFIDFTTATLETNTQAYLDIYYGDATTNSSVDFTQTENEDTLNVSNSKYPA